MKVRRFFARIGLGLAGWVVLVAVGVDAGQTPEAALGQTVFMAIVLAACYGFYKLLVWSDFGG